MKKIILFLTIITSMLYYGQSDCTSAFAVCGNSGISYTPDGHGEEEEVLGGCLTRDEHYSVWYSFSVETSGTLTFVIDPNESDDYDWAVYGPNVTCGNLGEPIRCSYAYGSGDNTGLNMTETETSEGAYAGSDDGAGFVRYLDVVAGETYYLIVDNFSASDYGFQLNWGGTAALSSPFNNPDIQPNPFIAPGENQDGELAFCETVQVFDFSTLSEGIINGNPDFVINYHYNSNDVLTGNNPIENPIDIDETATYYYSINYVDPTDPNNPINDCNQVGEITFKFSPIEVTGDKEFLSCAIEGQPTTGLFDLTSVNVTPQQAVNFEYYTSGQDAIDGSNSISNPTEFTSESTDVFVKVINQVGCFEIVRISLKVIPPVYSDVLKNKIICVEDITILDAGPDFDQYLWSTGAVTSSIDNVTVGTYWVDLTKGGCVARQEVKVTSSPVPVISDVKINNDAIELEVQGGKEPYLYSINGVDWQESNIFESLPRGRNFVYVKDFYNCDAVELEVTVPNLVNVITPNGDNFNDFLDYSALSYKKDLKFTVFDRYENIIFQNSPSNKYTWNGTYKGGKKVATGNYWYVISWKNPTTGTPFVYKGWILVKNR